jgi:hypothetical protein
MKYLINTTEVFRVSTIEEVEALQEEVKTDGRYDLASFSYKYKCQKQKGEIIDEWYQVSIKKTFNDEKEPCTNVSVTYGV